MNTEQLHAYLDGELTPEEVASVEAELARNPALAAELEVLRGVDGALSTLDGHDAPDDFVERVVAATHRRPSLLLRLALPIGVAAALVLAVFLPPSDRQAGDRKASEETYTYVWESDAETFGSMSLGELEDDILKGLDAA